MAVIEFMDNGHRIEVLVVIKTQLINMLRDSVTITHYRKV
jgi:aerobic-type carbon monoxide dehydrogenase small subunit (CoxS/CutS family)